MDNKKALKGCGIGCLGLIVIIVILTIVLSSCIGSAEEDKSFNFTIDEYEVALKKAVSDASAGTHLELGARTETEKNQYGFLLAEGIFVFVTVDDNGKVADVMVSASGNAFLVSNKEVLAAYKILAKSVDSTLSATQSIVLFDELGITGDSRMLGHESYYELNGIGYDFAGDVEKDILLMRVKPE